MGCVVYQVSSVNTKYHLHRSSSRSHSHHTHIDITHVQSRSPTPSSNSQDDELLENDGVDVSAAEISPHYSVVPSAQSQSGSSSVPGGFTVVYPSELEPEGDGADSASRLDHRERPQQRASRSNSARRRTIARPQAIRDSAARSRTRELQDRSPTESGDSTEEFLDRPGPYPHMGSQSQYAPPGYPNSDPSTFAYPRMRQTTMVPVPPQQVAVPYHNQFAHGQALAYPPQPSYAGAYGHHAPSQVSSPYTSPYHASSIANYVAPGAGYFPQQYPPQYPAPFPQPYMQYGQQMPAPFPYPDYRYQPRNSSPGPASANTSADKLEKPKEPDPEEIFKRFADMMKEERAQMELTKEQQAVERAKEEQRIREQALRQQEERARQEQLREEEAKRIREQALLQAAEKARADAAAAAARAEEARRIREEAILAAEAKARADAAAFQERLAAENRIREEARQDAIRAYEDQVRKAAEQAAREQQIRNEAAAAALKAAADEAAARAEKAAAEKKIADDAAAAAKQAAESEAAAAAAAAQDAAKKVQEEADAKVKEAEAAAAKAKAEAEEAEKKAAAAAPPEKKAPVRFKDAIGRNYNFPWERCCRWRDMEGLINQAFAHIDGIGEQVLNGRYDLLGPDKEIIMPNYWDSTIEPDMHITMMLWPVPEPKKEDEIIVTDDFGPDTLLNLDEVLNPPKKKGKKKKPGGLASWMLGGAPSRPPRSLKGEKRPDVAAGSQHSAAEQQGACTVM
ncbi:hypothetical protein, variant 1 [Exophiala mesophila]|uniref:Ubiquitin-like domain-containing protein n=1 Tax=Exophiala mesophila TaxID=212818 RepID=A0A0D1WYL8_EXOME|nr:hypothetical protein, variant 1 [Exophiala mesophila]KIV94530.1 hypothetical protein, variant 1 [Exophiala mesophila]